MNEIRLLSHSMSFLVMIPVNVSKLDNKRKYEMSCTNKSDNNKDRPAANKVDSTVMIGIL